MKVILALYLMAAACLTGVYVIGEMMGWEAATAAYTRIQPSVRAAPGSSGTSHGGGTIWHSGTNGGK